MQIFVLTFYRSKILTPRDSNTSFSKSIIHQLWNLQFRLKIYNGWPQRRKKHYSDDLWSEITIKEGNDEEVFCRRVYQCYRYMYSELRSCRTPRVLYTHVRARARAYTFLLALSNRQRACISAIRQYGTIDGSADVGFESLLQFLHNARCFPYLIYW